MVLVYDNITFWTVPVNLNSQYLMLLYVLRNPENSFRHPNDCPGVTALCVFLKPKYSDIFVAA